MATPRARAWQGVQNGERIASALNVAQHSRDEISQAAASRIRDVDVILDVGCGIRPVNFFAPVTHLCVEPYEPYLAAMPKDRRFVVFNSTWDQVMPALSTGSVDTVFLLDVIEHIEKPDGLRMLQEAQRIATCQVVVFTPLGYYPQSYEEDSTDRWGFQGGYWQTHRSGWVPEDFGTGWEVLVCPDFHQVDQNHEELEEPAGALWAVWTHPTALSEGPSQRAKRRILPHLRIWLEAVLPGWAFRLAVQVNSRLRLLV